MGYHLWHTFLWTKKGKKNSGLVGGIIRIACYKVVHPFMILQGTLPHSLYAKVMGRWDSLLSLLGCLVELN